MPFLSIPQCAEAVIQAVGDGKQMVNVLGFRFGTAYSPLDIQNLATAIDARVGGLYKPLLHPNIDYTGTLVRGLTNINDTVLTSNVFAGVGTAAGNLLPTNVTLCITLRSAFSGRSARGRFYALPTGESNLAGVNTFSAAYATDLVAFLDAVKADAGALGWTLSILSRRTANAPRPLGVSFPVVTIGARNETVDSQRGRLPKGH